MQAPCRAKAARAPDFPCVSVRGRLPLRRLAAQSRRKLGQDGALSGDRAQAIISLAADVAKLADALDLGSKNARHSTAKPKQVLTVTCAPVTVRTHFSRQIRIQRILPVAVDDAGKPGDPVFRSDGDIIGRTFRLPLQFGDRCLANRRIYSDGVSVIIAT